MSVNERVGICLVTWNGGSVAVECLRSVLAQNYGDFFVVVVDNHSSPADKAALEACALGDWRVQFVWNDSNRGFAAAANQAVAFALGRGAHWVMVLTQDTILPPDACARLLDIARGIPQLAIAAPSVVDQITGEVLSVGERMVPLLLAAPRTLVRYRRTRQPYRLVQGVLGCCMLVAASCWQELGGFREELFAYYEEVDLCIRARQKGYKVAVISEVSVQHRGWRGFGGGFTPLSARLKTRNLIRVARWHTRPWEWLVVGPSLLVLFVGSALLYCARRELLTVREMWCGLRMGLAGHTERYPELGSDLPPCGLQ